MGVGNVDQKAGDLIEVSRRPIRRGRKHSHGLITFAMRRLAATSASRLEHERQTSKFALARFEQLDRFDNES